MTTTTEEITIDSTDLQSLADAVAAGITTPPETTYTISVSDGAGGDDDYDFEGSAEDALAKGERIAATCSYDFGDDDYGDLDIEVKDDEGTVVLSSTVRRTR